MPLDANGVWVPDLFGKQWQVFSSRARALLVSGPRQSAKTWAVLHRIVRHLWEVDGASVAMFSKTIKNSKEGGTWLDLNRYTIPEWIRAKIGCTYTTRNNEGIPGWKVIGDTRTPYFKLRNYYGGESECRLFSLDFDADIWDKIKEQRFSLIYFAELQKFRDRAVLSATLPCLRMPHLKMADQMWIADTNPSDEGDQSWQYEVWFRERTMRYEEYVERCKHRGHTALKEREFERFREGLELIEMYPEDNIRLDPAVLDELKMSCSYDAGLYARDVLGQWVYGDGDASRHFKTYFVPNLHVVGTAEGEDESQWLVINPSPNCIELVTGWDPGEEHHACVIMESSVVNGRKHFAVLDELEAHNEQVSLEDFATEVKEIIVKLDELVGRTLLLDRAWTDTSVFDYSATADSYPHMEIEKAFDGRLVLHGVSTKAKAQHSQRLRVRIVRQLLVQGRLKVSAHCLGLRRMFAELKKGKGRFDYIVPDKNKHLFDALSYAIIMECAEEFLADKPESNVGSREPLTVQVA